MSLKQIKISDRNKNLLESMKLVEEESFNSVIGRILILIRVEEDEDGRRRITAK